MLGYEFIDPEEQIASEDFQFIESFLKSTGRTQIGWHYITDLTWIYSKVKQWPRSWKILDAGGGYGPVQFLMAEMGFHLTNIDMVLSPPPLAYRQRYKTTFKKLPSFVKTDYADLITPSSSLKSSVKKWLKIDKLYQLWNARKYENRHNNWRITTSLNEPLGEIQWLTGNLCQMPEIPSDYFDAIVSLSSFEHIPIDLLEPALLEIRRVLKPDACWTITTSGTEQSSTWFHEPSKGYCFSVSDLENIFCAKEAKRQNPNDLLTKYFQCSYLKENLADFYKKSGNYGMPWGEWNPKYIPVGLSR